MLYLSVPLILQAGVMERKLFTIPSFKIYGGVAGFFDFGPPGCAVKQNITQLWRQHFILEENMLEVGAQPWNIIDSIAGGSCAPGLETPQLTPVASIRVQSRDVRACAVQCA